MPQLTVGPQASAGLAAPAVDRGPAASRPAVPRSPRYHSLDLWRGVACLLVVFYHARIVNAASASSGPPESSANWIAHGLLGVMEYGNVGVTLFFVISGYCIAAAADKVRGSGQSLGTYFVRRFRRIFPPLWIVLICSVVFFVLVDLVLSPRCLSSEPWMQPRPWWYSPWQWAGNLTLTETWRHYFVGDGRGHFPGQAWTLCYEEQFYAVTGLLLLLSRGLFFHVAGLLTAGVALLLVFVPRYAESVDGFFFDGSWLSFAAGIAVYYRVAYASAVAGWAINAGLLAAAIASFWVRVPGAGGGVVAFGFALFLSLTHRWDRSLVGLWLLAPLLFCGQMCYSLYLVHQLPVKAVSQSLYWAGVRGDWPTLLVTVPACIAVSVLLGWVFFRTVERRFLNSPHPSRTNTE